LPQLQKSLLAWYTSTRRDLPWRNTRDPYRIWISEIMLQQTRVAAVTPRYEQFLAKFPSVRELAAARLEHVLAEWSGLGYYHRARNLQAAAKQIVADNSQEFPHTAAKMRELPGIGRYTAAAIASIAFNEPVAVVDGNVQRVLRRLMGDVKSTTQAWSTAQQLLVRERPGDFNQAMMELGALVCLPAKPLCRECPIRRFCRTRGLGQSDRVKPRRPKVPIKYGLVVRSGTVMMVQRSNAESLMAGMWELPKISKAVRRNNILFRLRHSITTTDYLVTVATQPTVASRGAKWIRISRLRTLPLTGLARKILQTAKIIE
jgi:A/G-specific adenine glycosylase